MTKTDILNGAKALGHSQAKALQIKANNGEITETEIIDKEIAIPAFDSKKDYTSWKRNSPVSDEGQVWLLLQSYDASTRPERPSQLRALWGLAHTKNPKKAKPWVAPFGTSGLYQKDECCLWTDGKVYISVVDSNNYSPSDYPDWWEVYTVHAK